MAFRTSICNGLAAIDDSKLGVWGKTPKGGFGVGLGDRQWYQSKASLYPKPAKAFRTSICNGLAAIDDAKLGVWGKTPKTRVWVKLGGQELYQSIARLWFAYM